MNDRSDENLVAASRRGDKSAYAQLVEKYYKQLFLVCLGIIVKMISGKKSNIKFPVWSLDYKDSQELMYQFCPSESTRQANIGKESSTI